MKAPKELIRQLPDLDVLAEQLEKEARATVSRAFPAEDRGLRERAIVGFGDAADVVELPEIETTFGTTRERWVEAGTRAINRIRTEGEEADLDPEEAIGLEAIILIEGRPAILIQDGRFFPPPIKWQILEEVRDDIEKAFQSVGRIELTGHPSYEWVGTGFLVAEDVIMTNRHVAKIFCRMEPRRRWAFEPEMTARIDYIEEFGAVNSAEFALTDVIGVHDTLDLALFRVERKSSRGLPSPEPLTIASEAPSTEPGGQVYTVGYPAWDGRRNDPPIMRKIFSNIFDVKRLQPGEIMEFLEQKRAFKHDCSTLGGNSGSCVIDLETNLVTGLHFGGRYLKGNYAVALWQLTGDPLLKKAKVNFG